MKLEINLPDGVEFCGLYLRQGKWGAIVRCTPLHWPSRYRATFSDLRPPEPKFHSCSSGSDGCDSAQSAIDTAVEKLMATMSYLDGITRAPVAKPEPRIDTAAIAGLDLGDIDL